MGRAVMGGFCLEQPACVPGVYPLAQLLVLLLKLLEQVGPVIVAT